MKKRLFITLLMVALFACIFAISISAAGQSYTSFDAVVNGTPQTVYSTGFDQWQGRIYINDVLYAEPPLDDGETYETISWLNVSEIDFRNAKLYHFTNNAYVEKEYGSNTGPGKDTNNSMMYLYKGWSDKTLFANVKKIHTGKATNISAVFSYWSGLEEVTIGADAVSFSNDLFRECTSLKTVNWEESTKTATLGQWSFAKTAIETIVIPDRITFIDGSSFRECKSLKSITLSNNLTSISSMFYGCSSLESIHVPASVTHINNNCFQDCTSLANITFGENSALKTIGPHAFENTAFVKITFPNSLEKIGQSTFSKCSKLESVNFGASFINFNAANAGQPPFANGSTLKYIYLPDTFVPESVRDKIFSWNDNNANEYNKLYIDLTFFFTGTQAQAQAILDAANGVNTYISSMKLISAEEYAKQVADGTLVTGVSGTPARYFVYGYNKCDAFYGGVHKEKAEDNNPCWLTECSVCSLANAYCGNENTHNVSYKIAYSDYTANGSKLACCSNENCEYQNVVVDNTLEPLFVYLGYSANMGGTKITVGYKVNQEALKAYEESTGKTLSYGVVACVADGEQNTPISVENGELSVSEKVVKAELMGGYAGFDFILTGFTSDYYNTALVMCAYIYDGDRVCYINKGGCDAFATSVTFSSEVNE